MFRSTRVAALLFSAAVSTSAMAAEPLSLDALTWRNIGPFRGGRATAVAGNPADPNTFFMGTAGGGIWKTNDAGTRWVNVSDGSLGTVSVGAIAVAPSNPKIVYAGMGEDTARANTLHSGDGMYRSVDGGKTWTSLGLADTEVISRILIDPQNPDVVYVAAQGPLYAPSQARGVYRTNDGGRTWKRIFFAGPTGGVADLAIDPRDPRNLYAAVWDSIRHPWALRQFGPASGIYKSSDGGEHWSKSGDGLPAMIGKIAVAVSAKPETLFALVQADPNSQSGLYRSDDSGGHWSLVNGDPRLTVRAFYYAKLFLDPKDVNKIWVPNLGLLRSTDGGKTFATITSTPHGDHHEMWINPASPNIVAEAADGGATISLNDGATWSMIDNQPTGQFYRISVDDAFPYRIYSAQQDNTTVGIASRSTGPGIGARDWRPVGGGESSYIDVDPAQPSEVYSTDLLSILDVYSEATDTQRKRPVYAAFAWGAQYDEFTKYRYSLNTPLLVSRHDPHKIYVGAQNLLLTTDKGKNWTEISPDLTHAGLDPKWDRHAGTGLVGDSNYDVLTNIAESPLVAGELWTGSSDGVVSLSRDGGQHWTRTLLPAPNADARVNVVEPSPFDPAVAYVAATRFQYSDKTPYLLKTTNYGTSWTRIDAGLPKGFYARVVRADPVRRGLLYAGTEKGVYVSFDDGGTWKPLGGKLPMVPITDLKLKGADLIASTSGRGIWILDNLSPIRQLEAGASSSKMTLFRPETAWRAAFGVNWDFGHEGITGENPPNGAIIYFSSPAGTPVTLDVLDASGKLVRRLQSGDQVPRANRIPSGGGLQRIVWDLRGTPIEAMPQQIHIDGLVPGPQGALVHPGSYSLRLTAGGETQTVPLTVRADPRWAASDNEYADQDSLLASINADLTSTRATAIRVYSARGQLESLLAHTQDPVVKRAGAALLAKLTVDRGALLYSHLAYVAGWVNTPEPDVVGSERTMQQRLHQDTTAWISDANEALGPDLRAFNALAVKAGLSPITPEESLRQVASASDEENTRAAEDDF